MSARSSRARYVLELRDVGDDTVVARQPFVSPDLERAVWFAEAESARADAPRWVLRDGRGRVVAFSDDPDGPDDLDRPGVQGEDGPVLTLEVE